MNTVYYKEQQTHFGLINVILLYRDQRHVTAIQVFIFRVVSATIQTYI